MSSWAEYKTPLSVLNFPARQTSQDMCLAASVAWSGLYFPAGQMEHLERELWRSGEVALSALNLPAGQIVQVDATSSEYVPALQIVQEEAAVGL